MVNKKEKIKKILNAKIFYFILGALIFGTIGVSAATYFPSNNVTYDNTESGLESTDVQGAIDELYNVCSVPKIPASEYILDKVKITTTGDGLYEDQYEDGKYFYKGQNPNNYITFNDEKAGWRILSLEADGTLKIVKSNTVTSLAYGKSEYAWASNDGVKTYLNGTYYNSLTATAKSQIVSSYFYVDATSGVEYTTISSIITTEKSKNWLGNIAIPNVSEFLRANSQSTCEKSVSNNNNYVCDTTNWMATGQRYWLLWGYGAGSRFAEYVGSDNHLYSQEIYSYSGVRPTLYISSEVKITGGSGTQLDPYTIE